jgi:microcystin-dependent protein
MVELTPGKGLNVPAAGTPNWDVPVNTDWRSIDQAIAGVQYVNAAAFTGNVYLTNAYPTGSTDPATSLSCLCSTIVIYGAIAGAVNLVFPDGLVGHWIIRNATSGNFAVNCVTSTGTYNYMPVPQGVLSHVHSDGHTFYFVGASGTTSQLAMIGEIKVWSGGYVPPQWMACDGRWLDRYANGGQYTPLYNVFGFAYGGNGSNAFAIPDLRGRVVAGADNMGTLGSANRLNGWGMTAVGGVANLALTTDQLPSHTHYDYGHGHNLAQNPHHHFTNGPDSSVGGQPGVGYSGSGWPWHDKQSSDETVPLGVYAGYASLTNTGNGSAFSILQPTLVLQHIIYTGV